MQLPHTTSRRLRWRFFWRSVIATFAVIDVWRATKHDGTTLSETGRADLHTDEPQGRLLFTLGCFVFWRHILRN